jgi:hypothetical protein
VAVSRREVRRDERVTPAHYDLEGDARGQLDLCTTLTHEIGGRCIEEQFGGGEGPRSVDLSAVAR